MKLEDLDLSRHERDVLGRYGFDAPRFAELRAALSQGKFELARNELRHPIAPPTDGDLTQLPADGSAAAKECEALGREALLRGEVAVVVLNGGMATRFGGVVKGVVEVTDGQSFIGLRLADVARAEGLVTAFLMNSFATDADTQAHLAQHAFFGLGRERVHVVTQGISIRLTPEGELFRDDAGAVSFYAPGHGDLFAALARSRDFARFVESGGKLVWISNVDNVGATLEPRLIGAHLMAKRPVSVEVARRAAGDKGGAPARVRGRVEVLEGFRFPPSFDVGSIPVFNTNTFLLDVGAVKADYPLTWFRADKSVDGQAVVQFERLMGEVTAFVDATYLVVPREGPTGRFLPVKTPQDLEHMRPMIRARFALR